MSTDPAGFEILPGRPGGRSPHGDKGSEAFVIGERSAASAHGHSAVSQELLRRYLLTRALGSSIRSAVQWLGIGLLLIAVLLGLGGFKILAVLVGILAIGVLLLRALLARVQRWLSGASQLGRYERDVEQLVGQTRKGLRSELRRVGLPGSVLAPLIIARRLARGRRRAETLAKLVAVDLSAVVPPSRVEKLNAMLSRPH